MTDSKQFHEVFESMCEQVIAQMKDAFEFQHEQQVFRPIKRSHSLTTDGGNRFFVGLSFEPCDGAETMPSRN